LVVWFVSEENFCLKVLAILRKVYILVMLLGITWRLIDMDKLDRLRWRKHIHCCNDPVLSEEEIGYDLVVGRKEWYCLSCGRLSQTTL
jgi:hypothetical protein